MQPRNDYFPPRLRGKTWLPLLYSIVKAHKKVLQTKSIGSCSWNSVWSIMNEPLVKTIASGLLRIRRKTRDNLNVSSRLTWKRGEKLLIILRSTFWKRVTSNGFQMTYFSSFPTEVLLYSMEAKIALLWTRSIHLWQFNLTDVFNNNYNDQSTSTTKVKYIRDRCRDSYFDTLQDTY